MADVDIQDEGKKGRHMMCKVVSILCTNHKYYKDRYNHRPATSSDHCGAQASLLSLKKNSVQYLVKQGSAWGGVNVGYDRFEKPRGGMTDYFNKMKTDNLSDSKLYNLGVAVALIERSICSPADSNPIRSSPDHLYGRWMTSMVEGDNATMGCFVGLIKVLTIVNKKQDFLELDADELGLFVKECKDGFASEIENGSLRAQLEEAEAEAEAEAEVEAVQFPPQKKPRLTRKCDSVDDDDSEDIFGEVEVRDR